MKSVGSKIKELREKLNLDQDELALLCEWPSASRVKRYENGLTFISIEDAITLSSVLGVPPSSFLYESAGDAEYIRYKCTSIPVVGNVQSGEVTLNDFVLTREGAHGNEKHMNAVSYRRYGLRLHTRELEPEISENDVLVVDSKCYPITNDIVIVKSFFDDLKIRKFIGHENGKFELSQIPNLCQNSIRDEHDISFVLGVVIGTKESESL